MDVLKIVAELIFAIVVSLPLSVLLSERFMAPWLQRMSIDLPAWLAVAAVFVVVSAAFLLREQIAVVTALEK